MLDGTENGEQTGDRIDEHSSLLAVAGGRRKETVEREGRIVKASFYAVQVFYSFFIM